MTRRSAVWHPFTQHALQPEAISIKSAEGAWLEAEDGTRILDAISSWWVVTHGHRHPAIMAAIAEQSAKLDQVIFAGFTHEPAEELAQKLVAMAPQGLEHVFFSDSGSTSIEVALKMALGYWRNIGEPRIAHRRARARLSRRHRRHDVGRRARRVQRRLRAAAVRCDAAAVPARGPGAGHARRARSGLPRRAPGRPHRRAADSRRRRHAHVQAVRTRRPCARSARATARCSSPTRS